jgi:mono/diheme cytochrome c family protein
MKVVTAFIIGAIALPLIIILVGILGFLPSDATSSPPGIEMQVGMKALDASLERRAKGLRNPVAGNDTAALATGMAIYKENCSGCHGTAKGPSAWGMNGFYPRAPQFWQEGTDVTSEEAYAAIHDGVRYSGMGAWRNLIKDDAMWKVATFVSHIDRLPPELQQEAKTAQ